MKKNSTFCVITLWIILSLLTIDIGYSKNIHLPEYKYKTDVTLENNWWVDVRNNIPQDQNGITFKNDPEVEFTILLKNTGSKEQTGELSIEIKTEDGGILLSEKSIIILQPDQTKYIRKKVQNNRIGYTRILTYVTDLGQNIKLAKDENGIATVHKIPNYDKWDAKSFAGATYINESEGAQRLGFKSERIYIVWSRIEKSPGNYDWSDIANRLDEARKSKIMLVPSFRVETWPDWIIPWNADPGADNRDFLNTWQRFVKAVANKLKDEQVAAYMIGCEPGRSLGQDKGLWLEKGGVIYGNMLERAVLAIDETPDKNVPIIAFSST